MTSEEEGDEPAMLIIDPSAAGQEPPYVSPTTTAISSDNPPRGNVEGEEPGSDDVDPAPIVGGTNNIVNHNADNGGIRHPSSSASSSGGNGDTRSDSNGGTGGGGSDDTTPQPSSLNNPPLIIPTTTTATTTDTATAATGPRVNPVNPIVPVDDDDDPAPSVIGSVDINNNGRGRRSDAVGSSTGSTVPSVGPAIPPAIPVDGADGVGSGDIDVVGVTAGGTAPFIGPMIPPAIPVPIHPALPTGSVTGDSANANQSGGGNPSSSNVGIGAGGTGGINSGGGRGNPQRVQLRRINIGNIGSSGVRILFNRNATMDNNTSNNSSNNNHPGNTAGISGGNNNARINQTQQPNNPTARTGQQEQQPQQHQQYQQYHRIPMVPMHMWQQHQQQQQHQQHRMPMAPMHMGNMNPILPPLEPRPVPNQTGVNVGNGGDNGGGGGTAAAASSEANSKPPSVVDMKKFECAICFEYMEHPVGCGACQTRFCRPCLHRVLRENNANNNNNNRPPQSTDPPNNSARCPHCRSHFTLQSMVVDAALQKEMSDCTDTVPCPFAGCNTELPMGRLKSHEATCPHMRVRCRYADWGCEWVGRKLDLPGHDERECDFRGGLGHLVERFRQGDARAGQILQQHHMQIGATSQMLSLHSRQLMMMRGRNAGNLADVAGLAMEVSLFPGRFSAMREIWSGMVNQLEARCMVCNGMLVAPSLLLVLRVSSRGFQLISGFRFETLSENEAYFVADAVLLSLIVAMLGALCVSCFFIDVKGSTGWTIYNIRNFIPGQPILRDLAAVCVAMIHFSAIEFTGIHPGILLWQFVTLVTVGYTAFVSRILEKNTNEVTDGGMVRSARAWPVVVFGLRYGFLTAACGFAPTVNAVAMLRLCKQTRGLSTNVTAEDAECFLTQLSSISLTILSSLITAFAYGTAVGDIDDEGVVVSWQDVAIDHALALAALAYVNASVFLLEKWGRKLGESNFHVGNEAFVQAHRASGAAVVPNVKPTAIGCAVFGVCSFVLLCIATG